MRLPLFATAALALVLLAGCSAVPQSGPLRGESERPAAGAGGGGASTIDALPPSSPLAGQGSSGAPYVRGQADAPITIDEYADFQ